MSRLGTVLTRLTAALRPTDALIATDGVVRCPATRCDIDIERCGMCPWVVAVRVDGPAGTVVTCRRPTSFDALVG